MFQFGFPPIWACHLSATRDLPFLLAKCNSRPFAALSMTASENWIRATREKTAEIQSNCLDDSVDFANSDDAAPQGIDTAICRDESKAEKMASKKRISLLGIFGRFGVCDRLSGGLAVTANSDAAERY